MGIEVGIPGPTNQISLARFARVIIWKPVNALPYDFEGKQSFLDYLRNMYYVRQILVAQQLWHGLQYGEKCWRKFTQDCCTSYTIATANFLWSYCWIFTLKCPTWCPNELEQNEEHLRDTTSYILY